MVRTPTEEQRLVIESPAKQFMVTASAGAGKTFVLVERYLWMIEQLGFEPHEILTITFTRKAAAEMKERIVGRLRSMGQFDRAQIAETGPIQTIHSFCERLLRENSLAAGIDPDFEIMDDNQRTRLADWAISRAIASVHRDDPEAEELLRLLAGKRERNSASPYAKLEDSIAAVLSRLRGTRIKISDLAGIQSPEELQSRFEESILESLPEEVLAEYNSIVHVDFQTRLKMAFKALDRKAPDYARVKFPPEAIESSMRNSVGLIRLVERAWAGMEFEMNRLQSFDYALLEAKAVALLHDSATVRERVSRQYRALMVDEAQDVNPVQHALLEALNIGWMMIVGDVQQSIYGFRLADVEIFRRRQAELETLRLTKNWRSEGGILAFVDDYFSNCWPEEYRRMKDLPDFDPEVVELRAYPGVEIWSLPEKDLSETARLIVAMKEETGLNYGDITVLCRTGKYAVEFHHRLTALGIKSRIVGGTERFYVRMEIRDLANILKCLADPYDDFALLAAMRSPIAAISLDSIAELALKKPVVEALEEFAPTHAEDAARIEQFRSWFKPLSGLADRMSAWEVLSEVLARSGYLEALAKRRRGERSIANVRKLLTLAAKEPELGPIEFAEQIREVQRLAHKEGDAPTDDDDADTLTIMTIHKAKGLEFDCVVIPEVHANLMTPTSQVEVDATLGLVSTKFHKTETPFHRWIASRRKQREFEEQMRILYVAMTRAKRRLCIVADPKSKYANSFAAKVGKEFQGTSALGLVTRTRLSDQSGD